MNASLYSWLTLALMLMPLVFLAPATLLPTGVPRLMLAGATVFPALAWLLAPGPLAMPIVLLGSRLEFDGTALLALVPVLALCLAAPLIGPAARQRHRHEDVAGLLLLCGAAISCAASDILLLIAAGAVVSWSALALSHENLASRGARRTTAAFLMMAELSLLELALKLQSGSGTLEIAALGKIDPDGDKIAGYLLFAGVGLGARAAALIHIVAEGPRSGEPRGKLAARSCYLLAALVAAVVPATLRVLPPASAAYLLAASTAAALAALYATRLVLHGIAASGSAGSQGRSDTGPEPRRRLPRRSLLLRRLRKSEAMLTRWPFAMTLAVALGVVFAAWGF